MTDYAADNLPDYEPTGRADIHCASRWYGQKIHRMPSIEDRRAALASIRDPEVRAETERYVRALFGAEQSRKQHSKRKQ